MPLKPLFPAKQLEKIPVADKPLSQGGKITYLSPEQFKEKFGCECTASIWGTEEQASDYQKRWQKALSNSGKLTETELKILHRLDNPFEDAVICFIDEKVGYGLFAKKDIAAGTIIGVYSGTLGKAKTFEEAHDAYDYTLDKNANDIVSAKEKGGITRFMQHLPNNYEK
ncbi:MAG: SET domain-containing protein-lysine N-methyltransferase [Gammaproteobacteria bacterium]